MTSAGVAGSERLEFPFNFDGGTLENANTMAAHEILQITNSIAASATIFDR